MAELPLGLFGAGVALLAAAELRGRVSAVASRGGRPDRSGPWLAEVKAPTLLIVGGEGCDVIEISHQGLSAVTCEKPLRIVPDATHLLA
ncbi:hypothetical protein L1965_02925 [Paracoccus sp. EGI L200073]|nr:hypothetical protein [Paracoccus salsus]